MTVSNKQKNLKRLNFFTLPRSLQNQVDVIGFVTLMCPENVDLIKTVHLSC